MNAKKHAVVMLGNPFDLRDLAMRIASFCCNICASKITLIRTDEENYPHWFKNSGFKFSTSIEGKLYRGENTIILMPIKQEKAALKLINDLAIVKLNKNKNYTVFSFVKEDEEEPNWNNSVIEKIKDRGINVINVTYKPNCRFTLKITASAPSELLSAIGHVSVNQYAA